LPAVTEDTIEAILDELDLKALTPQPQPERPLQNASEEPRPAISVMVAATTCSRELLRTLQSITEANQKLVERFGKKAETIVAVYGAEQTDPGLLSALALATDSGSTPYSGETALAGPITHFSPVTHSASPGNFACAEEFDARIVLKNTPNCAAAVNAAAAVARGEILVFLKSDLVPKRDCLCHILEAIADKKSLGGGTSVASEDRSVSSRLASMFMQLPLKLSGVSLGVMFVRKGVFRKLEGFKETLFSGETIEFALRLKKHAMMTGGQFSNVKAVCATRYGKGAFRLSLKEWFMLLVLPLV
jgi:GT2 family glycosyltransferase